MDEDEYYEYFVWSMKMSRDGSCVVVTPYNSRTSFIKVFSFDDTSNSYKISGDCIDGQPDTFFGWSLDLSANGSRFAIGVPNNSE